MPRDARIPAWKSRKNSLYTGPLCRSGFSFVSPVAICNPADVPIGNFKRPANGCAPTVKIRIRNSGLDLQFYPFPETEFYNGVCVKEVILCSKSAGANVRVAPLELRHCAPYRGKV